MNPQPDVELSGQRQPRGTAGLLLRWYSIGIILFHLYAAQFGAPEVLIFLPTHVAMYVGLAFLAYPIRQGLRNEHIPWYDWMLCGLSWVPALYIFANYQHFVTRLPYVESLAPMEVVMGVAAVLLTLEACRRSIGLTLAVLFAIFFTHALFGQFFPGPLRQTPVEFDRLLDHLYMGSSGLYGSITGISATFVLMFVLLGAVLERAGGGALFMNLAVGLMGGYRGGTGKAAVASSGLFGSISGSAVANVYATGTFTIPLMKRTGFHPSFAAGVEAVASSSGQLVPPIMGSAAFLIADFTRLQYLDIAVAATLPAFLYLFAVMVMVHLESVKYGLPAMARESVLQARSDVKLHVHLLLVLVIVVAMLVDRRTPFFAAYIGVLATVALAQLRSTTRLNLRGVLDAFELAARRIVPVAAALFVAALVVGTIELTGLGLRFTSLLLSITHGSLLLTLILVMLSCVILGMGLPTAAAYLIVALFGAPALIKLGVDPLAAHMFVFYYAILSAITPPVAIAAYAAASIANCPMQKAGWSAMKIGAAVYIVPFVMAYHPALLLKGSVFDIVLAFVTSVVGVLALAAGVQGFGVRRLSVSERALCLGAAGLLFWGGWITDVMGVALFGVVALSQLLLRGSERPASGETKPSA
ncbi:MAG TPA: TRAP transporter fused permease subunit [Zeimonas sp.]|nr:TRAP transporter fused permease subunit [Zeimonas sp.]